MAKTDDYDFHLVVLGNPRTQKRHRTVRRGRLVATYDPSAKDKEDILAVTHSQAPARPLAGPLRVDVELYYARPKSHYRTGKYAGVLKDNAPTWHTKRPDRDNADKIILDALGGVFWRDDSLVCDGRIMKKYSESPRTEIFITEIKRK